MPLAAMLIHALHPALEDGEEPFDRVRVVLASDPFFRAVVDGRVVMSALQVAIVRGFIGDDGRFLGDVGAHDGMMF